MATVVIVPGFGGSQLRHRWPTLSGWRTVWLEPFVLVATGLTIMALDDSGEGPYVPFFPSLTSSTGISLYYPTLERFLQARSDRLDYARSDWRKPLAFSAGALATQLADLGAREPVRVVAHSRGGLLAQAALQIMATRGTLATVRQVVGLCVPWGGSYAPVPYLGGWPYQDPLADLLAWTAPGILFASAKARHLLRSVVSTMPGLYELLPDPVRAAAAGDPTADSLYDPANWTTSGVPVSAAHLAAAHLRWLNNPGWPGGVRLDSIVGTGQATVCTQVVPTHLGKFGCLQGAVDGDGVVPAWSAQPPGRVGIAYPTAHQDVLTNPGALAILDSLLR